MLRTIAAIVVGATLTLSGAGPVAAAAGDYVFKVEPATIAPGSDAVIGVRLLNKVSGQQVADAVIFQTRLDMSPAGMAEMTGKLTVLPSDTPGLYRFRAETGMAGRWAVKLAAKVPGERETVRGEAVVVIPATN